MTGGYTAMIKLGIRILTASISTTLPVRTPVFASGLGEKFVINNFMFEFIPEPSTFRLAALGGVSLVAFLRRKRAERHVVAGIGNVATTA
jgi:hypothetical protein